MNFMDEMIYKKFVEACKAGGVKATDSRWKRYRKAYYDAMINKMYKITTADGKQTLSKGYLKDFDYKSRHDGKGDYVTASAELAERMLRQQLKLWEFEINYWTKQGSTDMVNHAKDMVSKLRDAVVVEF